MGTDDKYGRQQKALNQTSIKWKAMTGLSNGKEKRYIVDDQIDRQGSFTCVLKPKTKMQLGSRTSYIFASRSLSSVLGTLGRPGCSTSITCSPIGHTHKVRGGHTRAG